MFFPSQNSFLPSTLFSQATTRLESYVQSVACKLISLAIHLYTLHCTMNISSLGLSKSPASVLTELYPRNQDENELSLQEFLDKLPQVIDENKKSKSPDDLIGQLME